MKKTKATMPFKLKVINGTSENAVWAGEWKRMNSGRFGAANLVIFNETGKEFDFQLDAYSGAHSGYIGGKVEINGSKAQYKDTQTGAELSFDLKNGVMTVEANEKANSQAGAGVCFGGDYKKGELNEEFTLLSSGMVKTKEQENEFSKLVGEDSKLFLDTAQICRSEEDLDGYGADVHVWWVKGLAGLNESIIMILPDGKICAAVIDLSNNNVKVYTNAEYIKQVPKTIEKWRESFKNLKVDFIKKP